MSGDSARVPSAGQLALSFFWIAILSGIPLALHYDALRPLFSLDLMRETVPFGAFFHSLHLWSGYLFTAATLAHIVKMLRKRGDGRSWVIGVMSVPPAFFLLLSGFLLRGTEPSREALKVLIGLTAPLAIPSSLPAIAVHHEATLTILTALLVYLHTRRTRVNAETYALALSAAVIPCLALPGFPGGLGETLSAPWYAAALQEALRYAPAGSTILGGSMLFGITIILFSRGKDRAGRLVVSVFLAVYALLSLAAWIRGGIGW
jgi:hypothetical protein